MVTSILYGMGEALLWTSTLVYMMIYYPQSRIKVFCLFECVTFLGVFIGEFFGQCINDQFRVHEVFYLASLTLLIQMILFAFIFDIFEYYEQEEEEENLRGESMCDIISSEQHIMFLIALMMSALNTSAVRNSLSNLATARTTLLGTDEEVIKASLFFTFFVFSYPLYKLILFLKASTLV